MASPQLKNGFTRIANEILEAIAQTPLSGYEAKFIFFLLRKTYGYRKKSDNIAPSQICKGTKMLKFHEWRTRKRLIQRNIVTQIGNQIGLNKDYSQWTDKDGVTKLGNIVTQIGNQKLPKLEDTKESKDNIQKKNKVFLKKNPLSSAPLKEKPMYKQQSEDINDLPVIEDGEYQNRKKPNENENWKKFIFYWKKQCLLLKRIDPEISSAKDKPTFHRIKKIFANQDIISIIDFFLINKKSDEHLTISACFSADTVNQWKKANK